jgi:hypothetical protein
MFSHVVIFWTDLSNPRATDELLAGIERFLKPIPGIRHFHAGRVIPSHREAVDQSYQVALNLSFDNAAAQDAYQVHPLHLEFMERVFKPLCRQVRIYDFA